MFASFRRSVELARHYPDLYFVGQLTHDDIGSERLALAWPSSPCHRRLDSHDAGYQTDQVG